MKRLPAKICEVLIVSAVIAAFWLLCYLGVRWWLIEKRATAQGVLPVSVPEVPDVAR